MIRINLLPSKKKVKMPKLPIGTILGVLILLAVGYGLFVYMEEQNAAELEALTTEIDELKKKKDVLIGKKQQQLAEIDQQINEINNQIALIKRLVGAEMVAWSTVFEDLSGLVPKETVWLKSFVSEGLNKVIIQGMARNDPKAEGGKIDAMKIFNAVSKFMEDLERFDGKYYSTVSLSNAQKTTMHGQDAISFSLSAKIDRAKAGKSEAPSDGATDGAAPAGDAGSGGGDF